MVCVLWNTPWKKIFGNPGTSHNFVSLSNMYLISIEQSTYTIQLNLVIQKSKLKTCILTINRLAAS